MTDYREIIRLHSLKFSNVSIANSLCCSRNTVSEVLKLAETHSLEWPIPETLSNKDIEYLFYPNRGNNEGRRLPDYEYVYNELAKPGVTLSIMVCNLRHFKRHFLMNLIYCKHYRKKDYYYVSNKKKFLCQIQIRISD